MTLIAPVYFCCQHQREETAGSLTLHQVVVLRDLFGGRRLLDPGKERIERLRRNLLDIDGREPA